jgi:prophage regulatory protein
MVSFLSKKQVRELVLYSPQHIDRLQRAGKFPKRVRLGAGRVGWIKSEVLDWINARIAERDSPDYSR